ncbi:MAG: PorP/SprF family type IX secretion system membrane protein, partial [Bacteroidales bacterium]|nr:PorP/SprF family type IX secretion system membrane protein [Bacteroidales bacterium]
LLALAFCVIHTVYLSAQDSYFNRYSIKSSELSPAFTGVYNHPRLDLYYRNQWLGLHAYEDYSLAVDGLINRYKTGIGINIYNNSEGGGTFTRSAIYLNYARWFKIDRFSRISMAASGGVRINSLNWDQLIFADGIHPVRGIEEYNSAELPPQQLNEFTGRYSSLVPDFKVGGIYNRGSHYLGLTIDHLFQPNEALYNSFSTKLKRKYTFLYTSEIAYRKKNRLKQYYIFIPHAILEIQNGLAHYNYGILINRKEFVIGFSGHNAAIQFDASFSVGYRGDRLGALITYGTNISGLDYSTGGTAELNIQYIFRKSDNSDINRRYVPAPTWEPRRKRR